MNQDSFRLACLGCTKCQLLPSDVREALSADKPISSAHAAPRFGRFEKDLELDGVRVADTSSEAMLGTKGWILRYHVLLTASRPGAFHICPFCKQEPCMYVSRGNVVARRETTPVGIFEAEDLSSIRRILNG